jgi:hypothetical protein
MMVAPRSCRVESTSKNRDERAVGDGHVDGSRAVSPDVANGDALCTDLVVHSGRIIVAHRKTGWIAIPPFGLLTGTKRPKCLL